MNQPISNPIASTTKRIGLSSLAPRALALGFVLSGFGALAQAQEATQIDSMVSDVTVYGNSAIVTRSAPLPSAEGSFLISGLPSAMDPSSVRVRVDGGEVVGVDTRIRYAQVATSKRIQELELALKMARREMDHKSDASDTADGLVQYFDRLLNQERSLFQAGLSSGAANVERWEVGVAFFQDELKRVRRESREAKWALEDAQAAVLAANIDLSGASTPSGDYTYDLEIDLVSNGSASGVEVEYLVHQAGWTPSYDLRADDQADSVELVYRAKVQQNTGEDWEDVGLLLSTARPELGARAPELAVTWASVYDTSTSRGSSSSAPKAKISTAYHLGAELHDLGYLGEMEEGSAEWKPSFAGVMDSGLSVRFRLPNRETVESRSEPSTLLVGRTELAVEVEHYAVPALSERVWLRGRAENTTPWAMLPGEASVYFGDDFIGHSWIDRVVVGESFDLHLGADPGLVLEHTLIDDLSKGPSFFRSSKSVTEGWRVHVSNHGSAVAGPDGSVDVIVQEVLPSSADERLEVELESSTPGVSMDERWKRDREEKGILTWILHVPKAGAADLTWTRKLTHPKDLEVSGGN